MQFVSTFTQSSPENLLRQGAAALQLALPPAFFESCSRYLMELQRWNAKVNLTGLRTDRDIVIKLFLDSLAVLPYLGEARSLADLGSGAGFPGLVLKIARPKLALTLVESRGKKAAFLEYLVSLLQLKGVEVAQVRLTPRLARTWGPRFAAVTSRAAFHLPQFLRLAAPLLLPGGKLMALKGPGLPEAELGEAGDLAVRLGLGPLSVNEYRLPFIGESRLAVLAERQV